MKFATFFLEFKKEDTMEIFLIVMVAVVALMSLLLNLAARNKTSGYNSGSMRRSRSSGYKVPVSKPQVPEEENVSRPRNRFPAGTNYALAPKNPDIMSAALFELLSTKLGFNELIAFSDIILHPPMLVKYLNALKEKQGMKEFAEGLEFLCRSMTVNGFGDDARIRVAEGLRRKANNEFKMLKIQKNMDKIF